MSFSPESEQIDFGSHSVIIDREDRKVRIFSDMGASEIESSRDWRDVQEKLSELGVRTLREFPQQGSAGFLVAEGAF
jgi:hypothetical protein